MIHTHINFYQLKKRRSKHIASYPSTNTQNIRELDQIKNETKEEEEKKDQRWIILYLELNIEIENSHNSWNNNKLKIVI